MRIEFQDEGEVRIVRLEGRFVAGSDAEFLRAREALSQSGKRKVLLDCREVQYLDSTALNFIVGLYTMITKSGGNLAVCGMNQRMSEVLRITHLDQIIPVFADRQTALAAMAGPDDGSHWAERG